MFACSQNRLTMSLAKLFQLPTSASMPGREGALRLATRVTMLALVPVLMPGCEEASAPDVATTAAEQATKGPELPRLKWLDAHNRNTPERWLASREAKVDLDENDPAVLDLRIKLNEAAQRFGDATRMIANRAVQLEEMLAEEGISEHAPELIETLSSTATALRQREGFGSLSQHYFNLRKQGVGREVALQQLKKASVLLRTNGSLRG
jgi:hypothetical protein